MGKYQRAKGKRNERELRNILKAHEIPAENASLEGYDVRVADVWKGEVKSGHQISEKFTKWLADNHFLFTKRDRGEWLVTMRLEFFLDKFLG